MAVAAVVAAAAACTSGEAPAPRPSVAPPPSAAAPVRACPAGSSPDAPGPAAQPRPDLAAGGYVATMDTGRGQVVVLDADARTWTLDVCSNTWQEVHTTGSVPSASSTLVYDAATELTYAFGALHVVHALSLADRRWTTVAGTTVDPSALVAWSWAVLDPARHRVVFYEDSTGDMATYDLGDLRWRPVPRRGDVPRGGASVATFDTDSDRVLAHFQHGDVVLPRGDPAPSRASSPTPLTARTWSFDPASSTWSQLASPTPVLLGRVPAGEVLCYDASSRRAVAYSVHALHVFYPATRTWSAGRPCACGNRLSPTVVDDPVNGRVLVLGGVAWTASDGWHPATDVWAYDVASDRWTVVVPEQAG